MAFGHLGEGGGAFAFLGSYLLARFKSISQCYFHRHQEERDGWYWYRILEQNLVFGKFGTALKRDTDDTRGTRMSPTSQHAGREKNCRGSRREGELTLVVTTVGTCRCRIRSVSTTGIVIVDQAAAPPWYLDVPSPDLDRGS